MSTPAPAPPVPSLRIQQHRQVRRWERLMDRRIQNTEILNLFEKIAREAQIILLDPDTSIATRHAAERILTFSQEGVKKEGEDQHRDEQEAHELRLVDRELEKPRREWRAGEGA